MTTTERRSGDDGAGTDGDSSTGRAETAAPGEPRPVSVETVAFESRGLRCEADRYRPRAAEPPWPAVVMAHGFGGQRTWGLAPFAERFAGAGLAAFVFDHRHLGASEGTPRRLIDPDRQLDDWAAALGHVRSLEAVDADRVALWGTSFSGGHVLATARGYPDVAAVVAQAPFVDGRATVAHLSGDGGPVERARTLGLALADRLLAAAGLGPVEVPIASRPGEGGLLDAPGALEGFRSLVPADEEPVERTPARVVLDLPGYRPGRAAGEIETPVHVVVPEDDRVLPTGPTERVVERLADPSVHRVPAGHFDVYRDPWVEAIGDRQVAFLTDALSVEG